MIKFSRIFSFLVLQGIVSCSPQPAFSDEIIFHGPSHHVAKNETYNNLNWGLGYHWENGWVAGAYKNSFFKTERSHSNATTSIYAGYRWYVAGPASIVVGGVTGYGSTVLPAIVPTLTFSISESMNLHLSTPNFSLLHLSIGWRLK